MSDAVPITTPATRRERDVWSPIVSAELVAHTCENLEDWIADELQWLYDHYIEQRAKVKTLGRDISLDGSNIGKLWRGTYQGSLSAVAERIRRFRSDFTAHHGVGQPDFIATGYSRLIFWAAETVINVGEIGRIVGNYGDGKTFSLRQFAAMRPREVHYFECGESSAFTANLRDIAGTLGVTGGSGGSARDATRLREKIYLALRRRKTRLLIIDDLHAIFTSIRRRTDPGPVQFCEFLRKIHDKLGIAILISGTSVLPDKLEKGIWSEALEQLSDRGDTKLDLTNWTHKSEDLLGFYSFYELPEHPTAAAQKIIDDTLAAHSLRKLVFKLRRGVRAAKAAGHDPSWEHFVDAQQLTSTLLSNPQLLTPATK